MPFIEAIDLCAELMREANARPELDQRDFGGRLFDEVGRMMRKIVRTGKVSDRDAKRLREMEMAVEKWEAD